MKRLVFPLLMVSLGLNLGLLYQHLADAGGKRWPAERRRAPLEAHRREHREFDPSRLVEHRMRQMVHTLDLTGEQQGATRGVLERFVPQIVERRRTLETAHRNLQQELAMPSVDDEQFRARVGELNRAQSAIDSLVAEAMLAEARVLTPEQRGLYLELTPFGPMMDGPHRRGPRKGSSRREPPPDQGD
jgi:Spy/CpxP family protein refolding chaperone